MISALSAQLQERSCSSAASNRTLAYLELGQHRMKRIRIRTTASEVTVDPDLWDRADTHHVVDEEW